MVYYKGHDLTTDQRIDSIVGREAIGGGFNFTNGLRDRQYDFYLGESAREAETRCKAAGFTTELFEDESPDVPVVWLC